MREHSYVIMAAIKMAINPENENIISNITEKINILVEILFKHQNMDKNNIFHNTFGTFICTYRRHTINNDFSIDCNAAG